MEERPHIFIISAILCALVAISAMPALAGLGTTVPSIEANITAGTLFSKNITIYTEEGDSPMDLAADVDGVNQSLDGVPYAVLNNKDMNKYSATPFLKILPTKFHLGNGTRRVLELRGIVPKDVGEGGRYALLQIHSAPLGNGTVGVALAIEIPIKLSITGTNYIRTGNITDLKIAEPISANKTVALLKFKNTGNYHYRALTEAVLKDQSGAILANQTSRLGIGNIIPQATISSNVALTPAKNLGPGKYTLEAMVVSDKGDILDSKKIEFIVK